MNKQVHHFHFHSEYSLQDSTIKIGDIKELAEKKNAKALALTDHGNVDGAVKFYQELKNSDTIPFLGCEFYVADNLSPEKKDKTRYHVVAIAKNRNGFTSIMKALTRANLEGFYYRPRIDWDILLNLEDVIISTACTSGIINNHPNWDELLTKLYIKFKGDFYLEQILLTDFAPQKELNSFIRKLSDKLGIRMLFTNDVHCAEKEDWKYREVHSASGYKRTFGKGQEGAGTKDLYFKTYDQMVNSLDYFEMRDLEHHMVETWDEILEKCKGFKLEQISTSVPVAYEEAKEDPEEYLKNVCRDQFDKRSWVNKEKARSRMEHELKEICDLGFAEYFLLVEDMVSSVKKKGVMIGPGRGSVGSSLVAYLLGITNINPLAFDLPFERFISPGRHDLPDIDLDFEDEKRDVVLSYLKSKYGDHNVALVSTFSTMKGRGAIRDVTRVYSTGDPSNYPSQLEINEVAKSVLSRSGGDARASFSLEDTVSLFEKAKDFAKKYPHIIESACKLEGLCKNKGVHAAGIVVDTDDLYNGNKCTLIKTKTDEVAVNWDKKDLEYMGMMKMDVLGLKTLNVLQRIRHMVHERHGVDIDYENMEINDDTADPEIMKAFFEGDCVGIFQFGTAGMIQYLRSFQPKNFKELYQVNALFRPGTLRSGTATEFVKLKEHPENVEYINSELESILKETYGVVLFQEQIMYIMNQLGNIPWRTADIIRKVISKSEGQEKFESFRQQFMDGVRELNSMPISEAEKIFSLMKFHGSYSFNKSHSAEYTMLSWYTMWTKVHYPLEFYCASLQRASDKENISQLLTEASVRKVKTSEGEKVIEIQKPDINASGTNWIIIDDHTLMAGFDIINGISSRLSEEIISSRELCADKKFESYEQFLENIPRRVATRAKIRQLCLAGSFNSILTEEESKCIAVYIDEFKKVPPTVAEAKEKALDKIDSLNIDINEIFSYELASDFLEFNKKFVNLLDNKAGKIMKLESLKAEGERSIVPDRWYLGRFDEIKYGYRSAVTKKKGYKESAAGSADDLGGVYGIFRDDTLSYYATFTRELYHSDLKGVVEDLAGKYILMKAGRDVATENIFVKAFYVIDELKSGIFRKMPESLRKKYRDHFNEFRLDFSDTISVSDTGKCDSLQQEIIDCTACPNRQQCSAPVPFSPGYTNAVIIGEAPGRDEDESGKPFIGDAGRLLWKCLKEINDGLFRDMFHITNIQKCRPKDNKINDTKLATACANRWLTKEFELTKPKLILSLGRTCLNYFKPTTKEGIIAMNGKVEFSEKLGAWIVYCIHPASLLYDDSRTPAFMESLEKFMNIYGNLS